MIWFWLCDLLDILAHEFRC
uniref:Uncharacterized protein n=1 Tax=Arundo donax TaxID=35708 RepID=A0A0A9F7G0_ARUDO